MSLHRVINSANKINFAFFFTATKTKKISFYTNYIQPLLNEKNITKLGDEIWFFFSLSFEKLKSVVLDKNMKK